jgi:hypothetical protein
MICGEIPRRSIGFGLVFSGMVDGRFCRGFAVFGVQNVVKCVVKRGGFVVKVRLENAANRALRICQLFEIFLWIFFGPQSEVRRWCGMG